MARRDGGGRSPLVLHVVEAYGAGVAAVVHDYIASVPEVRHVVLAYRRPGAQLNERCAALFLEMPAGRGAQMRAVRLTIRTLQPDVIHAHSSYAGAYVRLAGPRSGARIVYSPHCYGFERRDLAWPARAMLWGVEAALAWRTDGVGVVGEWERSLARRLSSVPETVLVPHRVPVRRTVVRRPASAAVVTVGRIEAQKDPAFFAEAAVEARRCGTDRPWRWIGGGDPSLEAMLRAHGVEVTGWTPRRAVLNALGMAHAYVHTAAWEGNPVAVMEAAALGLPVVARDIGPLRSARLPALVSDPVELAHRVVELDDDDRWRHLARVTSKRLGRHGAEEQGRALRRLYGLGDGPSAGGEQAAEALVGAVE
jgi:glycosyltransferase involved in cell wall biosynthesis